jgi:hypothetical protein
MDERTILTISHAHPEAIVGGSRLWLAVAHDRGQSRHGRAVDQVKVGVGNPGYYAIAPYVGAALVPARSPLPF